MRRCRLFLPLSLRVADAPLLTLVAVVTLAPLAPIAAQAAARPTVAVLNLGFDGTFANVLEPGDTGVVHAATSKLYATLRESERLAVVDSANVAAAVAAAGGNPCDNACALAVARRLGAAWVVKGTVSKTSNLVWILSAALLAVESGRVHVVLQDGYELKGDAARMAPAGAHVFAQRVERAIAGHRPAAADP